MATISDLNTSISDLSTSEAFELILQIRQSRITPKRKTKVSKSKKKTKKQKDPLALLRGMSAEQRMLLIAELEDIK